MTAVAGSTARMEGARRLRRAVQPPAKGGTSSESTDPIAEWPGCRCFSFATGAGRHRVWGTALFSHDGLSVNVLGGTVPHLGAVAVGLPRPSLARPGRRSATTSVIALVGHKDDELARSVATELARHLGITVVVTAGVHLRRAGSSDIAAVIRNAGDAVKAILAHAASAGRRRRRRK
jgi:hypothetical protein